MKLFRLLTFLLLLIPGWGFAQVTYKDYFTSQSLRIDFQLAGNRNETRAFLEQLKKEPFWGGPTGNLIDTLGYGQYRFLVNDTKTKELLYSRGFNTLFQEWQFTDEALSMDRAFYQTITMPFPKKEIIVTIQERKKNGSFNTLLEVPVPPKSIFIKGDKPPKYEIQTIQKNGKPHQSLDLVIIAEGYTKQEMPKFFRDAKRMAGYLFSSKPFADTKDKFSIYAIGAESKDSGTDNPGEKDWRNTILNSSFYTFGSERYLTTYDVKSLRDIAAAVPYDQIYILVNTEKYGGGGIFNHWNLASADHDLTKQVFIHEFGHGLVGLADEYYSSEVAYSNYFNLDTEPWEPNITTLVQFEKKWKSMVPPKVPIPTPAKGKYTKGIGVFEGGGYIAKGVYRPTIDCRMKSNEASDFCPVCEKAIKDMIRFLTE